MYLIFMIASSLALIGKNQCSCSELTLENECKTLNCNWENSTQTCNQKTCADYIIEDECDAIQYCAWNNTNCTEFTQCSNYTINITNTTAEQCYKKSSTCIPGAQVNDADIVTCTQGFVTCEDVITDNICTGLVQMDGQMCWWNTSCIPQDVTYCTTITDSDLCEALNCIYHNNACTNQPCNGSSEDECYYFSTNQIGATTICQMVNGTCDEGDESYISQLTSENCLSNTGGTYFWNGSNCTACQGQSSSIETILSVFLTFLSCFV